MVSSIAQASSALPRLAHITLQPSRGRTSAPALMPLPSPAPSPPDPALLHCPTEVWAQVLQASLPRLCHHTVYEGPARLNPGHQDLLSQVHSSWTVAAQTGTSEWPLVVKGARDTDTDPAVPIHASISSSSCLHSAQNVLLLFLSNLPIAHCGAHHSGSLCVFPRVLFSLQCEQLN